VKRKLILAYVLLKFVLVAHGQAPLSAHVVSWLDYGLSVQMMVVRIDGITYQTDTVFVQHHAVPVVGKDYAARRVSPRHNHEAFELLIPDRQGRVRPHVWIVRGRVEDDVTVHGCADLRTNAICATDHVACPPGTDWHNTQVWTDAEKACKGGKP
jgi:hypothetical protein